MMIKIKKGFDIPILGQVKELTPIKRISKKVGIYGFDFLGMKPTMLVQVGEQVKVGTPLFKCKKNEGIIYTSPASGIVREINRGQKRAFISLVIENDQQDEQFLLSPKLEQSLSELSVSDLEEILISSGDWIGFRTRPFSKIPARGTRPHSIFVTATDTNPLAVDPAVIIRQHSEDFEKGLEVLTKLTEGVVHLCASAPVITNVRDRVEKHQVYGPHPSGNVGTHIHFIDPVFSGKKVWHIGYQNLIAIGHLFNHKRIWNQRYVALVGPGVNDPKLVLTNCGASIEELCDGELKGNQKLRIISGSVLNGYIAKDESGYLGRYHNQISVIEEGAARALWGWAMPGLKKLSVGSTFLAKFLPQKNYEINSCLNGGHRAIVPIGVFEKLLPLKLLATPLLTALACKDLEQAERLGCLELDEEDVALCTFGCNGKNDYGVYLRDALTTIEREG